MVVSLGAHNRGHFDELCRAPKPREIYVRRKKTSYKKVFGPNLETTSLSIKKGEQDLLCSPSLLTI